MHCQQVENISPYLVNAPQIVVSAVRDPLVKGSPLMVKGNQPTDGGHLLLSRAERDDLLQHEPKAERWLKRVLGADEFLNGRERWCLWLVGITAEELKDMPSVYHRVQLVANSRKNSPKISTKKKAETAHLFDENRQPKFGKYILVPSVSSERRIYVPIGFFNADVISTNLNLIIPNGTLYEFGILSSLLHNDWMRLVAGRLKSDYRYSATVVYNPFPWPNAAETQRQEIERLAEELLLTRAVFPGRTLAELYDPDKMPSELLAAHQQLDKAVDRLYRERPFKDAADRLSCLLARYEALTAH